MADLDASSTVPAFRVGEAERIASEMYGLAGTASALPSERDQNFLLTADRGKFVLKIAKSDEDPAVLDFQIAAIRHATARGVALDLPRIVPARNGQDVVPIEGAGGRSHLARLVRWLEGELLVEAVPHGPELLASLGEALAELDAALMDFRHPAMGRLLHWDVRHASRALQYLTLLPPARRAVVQIFVDEWEAIDWSPLRRSVIHSDANDYNVLVREGRVAGLLDFGDMVHSATVCDLAIAIAYAMLGKPRPLEAAVCVASAYVRRLPLTSAELDAVLPLAISRLCMSVCYAAYNAQARPDDPYQVVTAGPAWELLEQLARLPPATLRAGLRSA